jgi:hypothetical protein
MLTVDRIYRVEYKIIIEELKKIMEDAENAEENGIA